MSFKLITALTSALMLFACVAHGQSAPRTEVAGVPVNYDESRVGSYTLPDPLTLADGKRARDAKTWFQKRRPEIVRLFEENQFGRSPGRPAGMSFDVFDKGTEALDGKALRRQVTIYFSPDKSGPKMDLLIYLPAHARKPAPLLLNLSFMANSSAVDDPGVKPGAIWNREKQRVPAPKDGRFDKLNIAPFLAQGFGVATVYYGDIDPDFLGGISHGVRALYLKPGQTKPAPDEWGAIAAWAWGLSRAMDYLETDKGVDAKRVAIMGVSRLGKTVLWAGARDERFAMVIASCSGEGGAALSRRNYGETIKHLTEPTRFPYQFCANYRKYCDQVDRIPAYDISVVFSGAVAMALAQVPAPQPAPGQQAGRGGGQPAPTPPGPNPNSQYRLGPDSMPQEGVPKGEIRGPYTLPSNVYPGTQHTYWVYVPAQYEPAVPAALMVFQDGHAFKNEEGDIRAQNVMDNLIYRREIPVMIGVFINPGRTPEQPEPTAQEWGDRTTNRPTEYNSLDDKYARVITEELMPALYKEYNISKDPEMHGIGGSSSGAIAAFTVAWERPKHFRKVLSNVGSFVNLRGGHVYPEKVLASEKKPIRIFLCGGRNDNRGIRNGVYDEKRDWFYQNVRLMKALTQKGYDVNYSWGINLHGQKFGGAIMPEMMRWLWRDGPVSTDPYDMVERSFREPAARKN